MKKAAGALSDNKLDRELIVRFDEELKSECCNLGRPYCLFLTEGVWKQVTMTTNNQERAWNGLLRLKCHVRKC